METIRKYGNLPYTIGLLHGGPGASGEMKPVAEELSKEKGLLEFLQTKDSIEGQINELHSQILASTDKPLILIGFSWGAWLGILFSARYPELVKKLILVSSGALEEKYNQGLMKTRLSRLCPSEKKEAEELISRIHSGGTNNELLKRFGELMSKADSYELIHDKGNNMDLSMEIHQKVWSEAAHLRRSGELINCVSKLKCPLVVLHGDHDPHPAEGIRKPLSERSINFKMVILERCGHIPWKEKYAKDHFYQLLREET